MKMTLLWILALLSATSFMVIKGKSSVAFASDNESRESALGGGGQPCGGMSC